MIFQKKKNDVYTHINTVIFDMDGVIFDTESVWKEGFTKANEVFGASVTEEFRQSNCGKSNLTIRENIRLNYPDINADEYFDFVYDYLNNEIASGNFLLKDGICDIINHLKKIGCKIGLATSSRRQRAIAMFQKKNLDFSEMFDAMVFGDEVGNHLKPDPTIFLLIAEKLGVKPSECIVVEDSINGIKAAVNGGFLPVMVVDLVQPDNFCRENAIVLQSLKDIKLLKGLL